MYLLEFGMILSNFVNNRDNTDVTTAMNYGIALFSS
jgi:hypothetical protein